MWKIIPYLYEVQFVQYRVIKDAFRIGSNPNDNGSYKWNLVHIPRRTIDK